ncbi:DNA polymerase III subunit beta [Wolbachia endosymbiont of Howardula sp.]|uniref:DNA polymerase III subunit beta n=1 Tax=Wolbachia endosymbiont of Howardula sp. TaxID=2916816 RepID=UPI00217E6BDD|nr:DNA polymerase III subunit beta [Wolbachia endosymbiont of Howardula sp.]UWI83336.1 DNA polymerase III subunit beta [Wolbachia endosymbiont of Howardula sp.]
MNFSVRRDSLLNILSRISGVVDKNNSKEIISYLNISTQENSIKFMATDLDIAIFASLDATILQSGEVKISVYTLHSIVKKLSGELIVTFTFTDQGKLLISCGNSYFSLPNLISNHYPSLEEDNFKFQFSILKTALIDLLNKTKFAISLDDTRYNLNGIYLHTDHQFLYSVATDGHRLSCIKTIKPKNINSNFGVIIPRKTVLELLKISNDCNDIHIKLSERKILFICNKYILISKLIDGHFPNYISFIHINHDKHVVIDSNTLSDVIERVSVILYDKVKAITLSLQFNLLTLYAQTQDSSDSRESIPIDYNNLPIKIGLNARYLLDALSCINNKCKIQFTDDTHPIIITDEDDSHALYIIMPMRI